MSDQWLYFLLIPAGAALLAFGIWLLWKSFAGKCLLEMPFQQQSGQFTVVTASVYSVWHKGQLFRRAPVDMFRPKITRADTNEEVELSMSLFRPAINGTSNGRMELFTFYATPGNYRIELAEGASIPKLEIMLTRFLPGKPVDLSKYFIQVRESRPFIFVLLGILSTAAGGAGVIFGFIFGLMGGK